MKSTHRFFIPVLAAFCLFCGCTVINPGPPPTLYTLSPRMPERESGPALPYQLTISLVNTSPAIATKRIAVRPKNNEIGYFANVSWIEFAPDMVKRLQIESLESTGRLEAVSDDMAGFLPNYRLSLEVRDFSVHHTPTPTVEVCLAARLINLKNGKSIGFLRVKKEQTIASSNFNDTISAFNNVLGLALTEITQWTIVRFEKLNIQQ